VARGATSLRRASDDASNAAAAGCAARATSVSRTASTSGAFPPFAASFATLFALAVFAVSTWPTTSPATRAPSSHSAAAREDAPNARAYGDGGASPAAGPKAPSSSSRRRHASAARSASMTARGRALRSDPRKEQTCARSRWSAASRTSSGSAGAAGAAAAGPAASGAAGPAGAVRGCAVILSKDAPERVVSLRAVCERIACCHHEPAPAPAPALGRRGAGAGIRRRRGVCFFGSRGGFFSRRGSLRAAGSPERDGACRARLAPALRDRGIGDGRQRRAHDRRQQTLAHDAVGAGLEVVVGCGFAKKIRRDDEPGEDFKRLR
jgi:hypothetical protein